MYTYRLKVLRVVDGDTLHGQVSLGLDCYVNLTLRLAHINTPERNQPGYAEATTFTNDWIEAQKDAEGYVRLRTIKDHRERYGRYLAVVDSWRDGEPSLNTDLLNEGLAVIYTR